MNGAPPSTDSGSAIAWLKEARFPFVLWLVHRAGVLLVSGISLYVDHRLARPVGVSQIKAIDHLCLWDCGWYTSIAKDGYERLQQAAFWPLFPWMGRLVHTVTGLSEERSLVLVANLCGLAGLIVVYKIFKRLEGEHVARIATALVVLWPFSFFQAAGLAESPMLWASALTLWWAMRQRYVRAGVALGLGILARHLTGFAGLGMVVELLRAPQFLKSPRRLALVAFALLVPFAIAAIYPLVLADAFHDPLAFIHARALWGGFAYMTLKDHFTGMRAPEIELGIWFSAVLLIGNVALLLRRRWWTLAAYAVPLTASVWLLNVASLGRYAASAWPAFLPFGVWLARRPTLEAPVLAVMGMLQAMLVQLFVHNFAII